MKKFLLFLLSLFVGIGLLFWVFNAVGWQKIKNAFLVFTGWQGLAILGLTILIALLGNWRWQVILRGIGEKISFKKLFPAYLAGYSIIYLAPILIWGGEFFRAYFLKEKNSVVWPKSLASVFIDRIWEWIISLTVIFFSAIFLLCLINLDSFKLKIIFAGIFSVFFLTLFLSYIFFIKKKSFVKFFLGARQSIPLETEKEIVGFFKIKRLLFWRVVVISLLRISILYLRAWLLIMFLEKNIGGLAAFSVLGFYYLASLIPIPASLGVHEAAQTFAFNNFGLNPSTATAFTMITRGADLFVAFAGLVFLFGVGIPLLKKIFLEQIGKLVNND